MLKKIINITDENINFESIKNKEYYPQELSNEIQKSTIVLLPFDGWRDYSLPIFIMD